MSWIYLRGNRERVREALLVGHVDEVVTLRATAFDELAAAMHVFGYWEQLEAIEVALIRAVAEVHPRTIVAVMVGSAVVMEAWREAVAAILMLWYPGMEGCHALADILYGAANPSGKLPFVIPKRAEDLPTSDRTARRIVYVCGTGTASWSGNRSSRPTRTATA